MSSVMKATRTQLGIAAAVFLTAGAGSAVAVSVLRAPDLSTVAPKAAAAPAGLASAFPVIARARVTADGLPSSINTAPFGAEGGSGAHYGVNPSLTRRVTAPNGMNMWIIPGSQGVCIMLATGQGACGSSQRAETEGIFVILAPISGRGPSTVDGILPSGASADLTGASGAPQPVDVAADGAFSVTGPQASTITVHTTTGSAASDTLGLP